MTVGSAVKDEIVSLISLGKEAGNRVQLVLEAALGPTGLDEEFPFAPHGENSSGRCTAAVVLSNPAEWLAPAGGGSS